MKTISSIQDADPPALKALKRLMNEVQNKEKIYTAALAADASNMGTKSLEQEKPKKEKKSKKKKFDSMAHILKRLNDNSEYTEIQRQPGLQITESIRIYMTIACVTMNLIVAIIFTVQLVMSVNIKGDSHEISNIIQIDPKFERSSQFASLLGIIVSGLTIFTGLTVLSPTGRIKAISIIFLILLIIIFQIVLMLLSAYYTINHSDILRENLKNSFTEAMSQYDHFPLKRKSIDRIQLKYECCGNFDKYTEWFDIDWIDFKYMPLKDLLYAKHESGIFVKNSILQNVPFSCCSPTAKRPCIDTKVTLKEFHVNYDPATQVTLNEISCTEKITNSLKQNLSIYFYLYVISIILETCIFFCLRIVYLSLKSLPKHFPTATVIVYRLWYHSLDPHDLPPSVSKIKSKQSKGGLDVAVKKFANILMEITNNDRDDDEFEETFTGSKSKNSKISSSKVKKSNQKNDYKFQTHQSRKKSSSPSQTITTQTASKSKQSKTWKTASTSNDSKKTYSKSKKSSVDSTINNSKESKKKTKPVKSLRRQIREAKTRPQILIEDETIQMLSGMDLADSVNI